MTHPFTEVASIVDRDAVINAEARAPKLSLSVESLKEDMANGPVADVAETDRRTRIDVCSFKPKQPRSRPISGYHLVDWLRKFERRTSQRRRIRSFIVGAASYCEIVSIASSPE